MFKIQVIVGAYIFLFVSVALLLLVGESFGASFRSNYGEGLLQLLQGIVAAFLGFLTAFAAEK